MIKCSGGASSPAAESRPPRHRRDVHPIHWLICAQVGYPSRAYVWVLARKPEMPRSVLDVIKKRLVTEHQYPEGLPDLVEVPQSWDRDATAQFGWKRRGVDVSPK